MGSHDKLRSRNEEPPFAVILEQVSSAFARVPSGEIGTQMEQWLEKIARCLGLDRSVIAEFLPENTDFQVLYQWTRAGFPPVPKYRSTDFLPWVASLIRAGTTFVMPSVRSLPAEANRDKEFFSGPLGPKATVIAPLAIGGKTVGAVSFADFHRERQWSPALLRRHRVVADIFANAMSRQRDAIESARLQNEAAKLANFALLGEMTVAMAHELNHPLGAILANAQTARRILERPHPRRASLKEIIDDIISAERRASDYIRQVQNVFRNEIRIESFQVSQLLATTVALTRSDLLLRGIALKINIEKGLPNIAASRTGIEQVLLNLVRNAADAVTLADSPKRIVNIRAFQKDARSIAIAVSDTGHGVTPGDLDRIFEPLFTTKEKGTGMGLAIVRSIVESYGGEVHVRQSPNRGATFEFTVPSELS